MGNTSGVVQWVSQASIWSGDGLQRWEEVSLAALSTSGDLIDAARLVAAWPYLRGAFLSYVQSGRWIQSYYFHNADSLFHFPVHLPETPAAPLATCHSCSTLDHADDVHSLATERSAGNTVLTEPLMKENGAAATSCAAIHDSLKLLQPLDSPLRCGQQSYALLLAAVFPLFLQHLRREQSQGASASVSAPASPIANGDGAMPSLDSFGGRNAQENALRQLFLERFFHERSTPCDSPSSSFSDLRQELWHLDSTLVAAMAQLDFMQLHGALAVSRPLCWPTDLLTQLEALPIGIALVVGPRSGNDDLTNLRLTYCNSRFHTAALPPRPSRASSLASSFATSRQQSGSSLLSSSSSSREAGSSRVRRSLYAALQLAADGSSKSSRRYAESAASSLRLSLPGSARLFPLPRSSSNRHRHESQALHRLLGRRPGTCPSPDAPQGSQRLSRQSSASSVTPRATVDTDADESEDAAVSQLYTALASGRQTAVITTTGASGRVLWLLRPVSRSESAMFVLQLALPHGVTCVVVPSVDVAAGAVQVAERDELFAADAAGEEAENRPPNTSASLQLDVTASQKRAAPSLPAAVAAAHMPVISCDNARFLQLVKVAEDVCNLLPPLLRL